MNRISIFTLLIIGILNSSAAQISPTIQQLSKIDSLIKANMEMGNTEALGELYYMRGVNKINISVETGDALFDLQTSATYARYHGDTLSFHKANVKIAELYTYQEIYYDDAITMLEEAIDFYKTHEENALEAKAFTVLSKIYENKQEYEFALNNIRRALKLNETIKDTSLQLECNIVVSNLLSKNGNIEKAISLAENNLKLSQILREDFFTVENLLMLAEFYKRLGNYDKGIGYLDEKVLLKKANRDQQSSMYLLKSDYANEMNDLSGAFQNYKKHIVVKDSLKDMKRTDLMNSMTYEFRTRDKEREILRLENDSKISSLQIDQKNRLVLTLFTGLIIGLLALFLIIRFYVQKIKASQLLSMKQAQLDAQKIKDLENDFKIKNLESMVIGQEEERKRISTDLHDSLGGMLSTLKLQYDSLQFRS